MESVSETLYTLYFLIIFYFFQFVSSPKSSKMFSRSQLEQLSKDQLIDIVLQFGQLSTRVSNMIDESGSSSQLSATYVPPSIPSIVSPTYVPPSELPLPSISSDVSHVSPTTIPIYNPPSPLPTKFVEEHISKGSSGWNEMCRLFIEVTKNGSEYFKKGYKPMTLTDARKMLSKVGEQLWEFLPHDTRSPGSSSHKKPDWNKLYSSYMAYDEKDEWHMLLFRLYEQHVGH